jgi:hypothetical protein
MSGTMQSATGRQIIADHVIGYGDKGEHILEYQGEFFYENGELLKDNKVAEQLPEPFKKRATEFVSKHGHEEGKAAPTAPSGPTPPGSVGPANVFSPSVPGPSSPPKGPLAPPPAPPSSEAKPAPPPPAHTPAPTPHVTPHKPQG